MDDEEKKEYKTPNVQDARELFSVFVTFKNNPPTKEEMVLGGKISEEFLNIVGPDAEGFPDCVDSVIIRRSKKHGKENN